MDLRFLLHAGLFVLSLTAAGAAARAACVNPAAEAGEIAFNAADNVMMHCDGSHWHAWVKQSTNYNPTAMRFDGTDHYLRRSTAAQEVLDGKRATVSFWVRMDELTNNYSVFGFGPSSSRFGLMIDATGRYIITARNSSGTIIYNVRTDSGVLAAETWQHVLFSFDLDNPEPSRLRMYLDNVNQTMTPIAYINQNIDFDAAGVGVGANPNGTNKLAGAIADLWVETGLYVNLDDAAVREKFISPDGAPQWLGVDGSAPLGIRPDLFFSGGFENWHENKGTAGSFTVEGGELRPGIPILSAGPAGCATPGVPCPDGTIYAGISPDRNVHMFTTAADAPGTYAWKTEPLPTVHIVPEPCFTDTEMGGESNCITGEYNTAYLVSQLYNGDDFAAARYCDSLAAHGYDDWYLPSQAELDTLYRNRTAIGGFSTDLYWTSSEAHIEGEGIVHNFATGMHSRTGAADLHAVRCVRKSSCSSPYGRAGALVYNADSRVLQWCDGVAWRPAGPVNPATPTGGCSDPSGTAGDVRYNSSSRAIQYCDGGVWQKVVTGDLCSEAGVSPGTVCADGSVYAGRSPDGDVPMFVTPVDLGSYIWGPTGTDTAIVNCTGSGSETGCATGETNTGILAGLFGNYDAAKACASLSPPTSGALGHDDWYLPSRHELEILYSSRGSIGGFQEASYWSSSEQGSNGAWHQSFSSGSGNAGSKLGSYLVRCARR